MSSRIRVTNREQILRVFCNALADMPDEELWETFDDVFPDNTAPNMCKWCEANRKEPPCENPCKGNHVCGCDIEAFMQDQYRKDLYE